MATTANLLLELLVEGQAGAEIDFNDLAWRMDVFVTGKVASFGDNTPPGSPSDGDAYVIGGSPTGDWAGQANKITYYQTGWKFVTPVEGMTIWVADTNDYIVYDGSNWQGAVTVADLNQTISGTYTQSEVQDISDKVDELLGQLRLQGIVN